MHTGTGQIDETFIQAGRAARITCAPNLVPAPGQYLLAHALSEPDAPLPHPVFLASSHPRGFYAAQPLPVAWTPGTELSLRGPLGRGFHLPAFARRVALAAFDRNCSRISSLLEPALAQKAEITLLTDNVPDGLPPAIEILPLTTLTETAQWADYLAIDIPRALIATIQTQLEHIHQNFISGYAMEILVETPLPCGGVAECGVCAIHTPKGYRLACKEGPVFDLKSVL
jgi:dihydroorotate dehydrogenase electron transfer subunit